MNILSLFDGMSTAQIAIGEVGATNYTYFASEIDKYTIKVTQKNYPDTKQIGCVTDISSSKLPDIDLLIGGSPCQGFSFAGKGLNFNDKRSVLFFEYIRLLNECKPKWFLFENVVMKKEWSDIITSYLGVKPIMINSNLVSAQNRKRLYWTNINFQIPDDMEITWGNIREYDVSNDKYYYSHKALHWIGQHGTKKNKVLKIHSDYDKMQMVEASHFKKYSSQRFFGIIDSNPFMPVNEIYYKIMMQYPNVFSDIPNGCRLRFITPLECGRLQNVPESYIMNVSDTQAYKMLGNAFTVDIIKHILKNIIRNA